MNGFCGWGFSPDAFAAEGVGLQPLPQEPSSKGNRNPLQYGSGSASEAPLLAITFEYHSALSFGVRSWVA